MPPKLANKRKVVDEPPSSTATPSKKTSQNELPPVLYIEDITSKMLELYGFVAPIKIDAFQKIVNKLLGAEILVQRKQADADLPFIFVEDVITDLRANIDLYVGQDGKSIFEKILEKMQLNNLPPPVFYIKDLVSELLELDGYVAIEKNGDFQNILNKLKGTKILVQKKQADVELPFISEMRANIDRYVGQVGKNLLEKIFETMKSKRLVRKRTENQNSNREEVIVEVDRTRFVGIDPPKEERLDNYGEVVLNDDTDGMQNNSPYVKQELIEVDEQPNVPEPVEAEQDDAAMELNGFISDENPEQSDSVKSQESDGEDDEEHRSGDSESSEDPPQRKLTRRSPAISIPVKKKPKLSHEELEVRRLSRLSHGELIDIIRNPENPLKCSANTALLSKQERHLLDITVYSIDRPVTFLVHNYEVARPQTQYIISSGLNEVVLNKGDAYGDELACLIATLLESYDVSKAVLFFGYLHFGNRARGVAIPFEKYFEQRSDRINIRSLNLSHCELASILRFVCPGELIIYFPCAELFDKDGNITTLGVRSLTLGSRGDVHTVDAVMEQCDSSEIKLTANSYWSDHSIKKAHANSNVARSRTIKCFFYNIAAVQKHQRTRTQWEQLFAAWQSSYTLDHPKYDGGRVRIEFSPSQWSNTATFHLI